MSLLQFVNVFSALGALIGIICLAYKRKIGFIVFFGVECCMFYIGYKSYQYGVLAMSIIYFFANIFAYFKWRKDDNGKERQ